jgi:hypothetical protein
VVKVEIMSGNQAGTVVEMDEKEAQANVATGYARYWVEPKEPKPVKADLKPAEKKKAPEKKGGR